MNKNKHYTFFLLFCEKKLASIGLLIEVIKTVIMKIKKKWLE